MGTHTEELKKLIAGDVLADEQARTAASTDASLFEVMPELVVSPKNVDDVKALVRFANERKGVSLTARSGGTGMDGGALTESIVVDFTKYFTHIGQPRNLWTSDVQRLRGREIAGEVTLEPGVFYRDFEKQTLAKNLLMPSYPASREICTVGGMVANNAGGELTLQYGKTENYVRKLNVVLSDGNEYTFEPLVKEELDAKIKQSDFEGEVYQKLFTLLDENYDAVKAARPDVSKNSAGYFLWNVWNREDGVFDLTKLFVGSQGTLGLVTEITFDLVQPLKHSQMMVVFLDDTSRIGELVGEVLKHKPTTFESYDDKTLRLATRFFFSFVKRLGVQNLLRMAVNMFGEGMSILRHGFPKLVLQITFDGDDPAELKTHARELAGALKNNFSPRYWEVIDSTIEAQQYWLIRRESFNLLRHKVKGRKTAPFVDDICVRPDVLPEFFPKLERIFKPYEHLMQYNIAGHIGNGNFHIIPLMDLSNAEARAAIPKVAQQVYDLVLEYKGSITGEHNDGIIRTPFLRRMYGDEVYKLFEEVKHIFDPEGIFNPGKKVPSTRSAHSGQVADSTGSLQVGTLEYAVEHIKKHN